MGGDEEGTKPVVRALGRSMGCPWPGPRLPAADAAGAEAGTRLWPLIHFTVLTWLTRLQMRPCFQVRTQRLCESFNEQCAEDQT